MSERVQDVQVGEAVGGTRRPADREMTGRTRFAPVRCAVLVALCGAVPRVALACPVCFGRSDSPAAQAINLGVFVLLGVIVAVLGAFAAFMIYLNRRAKLFADVSPGEPLVPETRPHLSLPGSTSEEGTAVC